MYSILALHCISAEALQQHLIVISTRFYAIALTFQIYYQQWNKSSGWTDC